MAFFNIARNNANGSHSKIPLLSPSDVYKPKLEEILNDIIVITEIAELGAEADNLPDETGTQMNAKELVEENLKKRGRLTEVRWSSVKFQNHSRTDSDASSIVVDKADTSAGDISPLPELPRKVAGTPPRSFMTRNGTTSSRSSGLIRIKNLLDRWEEPVNKLDKVCGTMPTIPTPIRRVL